MLTMGYSASVEIELFVGKEIHSPTHTCAEYLLFREPVVVETGIARLVITVDEDPLESVIEILRHESPSCRIPVRIVKPVSIQS
jgi:hypothetical protein